MRLVLIKSIKTFICVALFFALLSFVGLPVAAAPSVEDEVAEKASLVYSTYVHLDISQGSIVISETGYTIGNMEEEIAFSGVYYITGTAPDGAAIIVKSGSHTLLIKDLEIDQRTEDGCCPVEIGPKAEVELNINGDNILYAGSGRSGIELNEDAVLDINVYGEGSLSVMSYPEWRSNRIYGSRAVDVPLSASIDYPQGEEGDRIDMYCGIGRKEFKKVFVYSGQMYMNLTFDMQSQEHVVSEKADCLKTQICLHCAEELDVTTEHTVEKHATCTEAGVCAVCKTVVEEPLGHKGAWRVIGYTDDKVWRLETLTCKICKELLNREVKIK